MQVRVQLALHFRRNEVRGEEKVKVCIWSERHLVWRWWWRRTSGAAVGIMYERCQHCHTVFSPSFGFVNISDSHHCTRQC
jgi:hypothetical protein